MKVIYKKNFHSQLYFNFVNLWKVTTMFHNCRIAERNTHHSLPKQLGKNTTKNVDKLLSVLATISLFWTLWKGSWMHKSSLSTLWWFWQFQLIVNKNATSAIFKTYYLTHENNQRIWVLKDNFLSAIPPKVASPLPKSLPNIYSSQTQTVLFK